MSLINDALKRAKQTQPLPPPVAPGPAMTPVEHKHRMQWPVVVVPILLLAAVLVATWFFWAASQSSRKNNSSDSHSKVAAREKTSVSDAAAANDPTERTGTPSTGHLTLAPSIKGNGADAAQATATNAAPAADTTIAVLPPPKPHLKLQAIFYRSKNPSAVINSKTVFRGDKVADAKVLAIDRESVTLWANGQTNVLTLP
jgi:hypothetical protein